MDMLTSQELMEKYKVSRTTVFRWEKEGLPFTRVGSKKWYNEQEVQYWVEKRSSNIAYLEENVIYQNSEICETFKCSNQGGMRRSHTTNTLVIISDYTKGLYNDRWESDILYYTGMGRSGDQSISSTQNKTLLESNINGVRVFLFEVFVPGQYVFRGQVKLVGEPYQEQQKDENGQIRNVWIFPLSLYGINKTLIPMQFLNDEEKEQDELLTNATYEEVLKKAKLIEENQKGLVSKRLIEVVSIQQNPWIAEVAKRRANGKCDLCGMDAPFINKKGKPYLETHHVEMLSDGGKDTLDNICALCPNCHKKMHELNCKDDIESLKRKIDNYNEK